MLTPPRPTDPAKQAEYDLTHPGGPVFAPREIIVPTPMPADSPFGKYFSEDPGSAPASLTDPYWISGHWIWKNTDWEWIDGRWVQRPRPRAIWVFGHTTSLAGRIYWKTGYWE